MKKYNFLFIFVLFSSIAFSASNVYVSENSAELRSDKTIDSNNTIQTLLKDTQLILLTMHYSGWSKVSLGDLTGWILSDQLTEKVPEFLIKNKLNTDTNKIQLFQQELLRLKNKNNDLSARIIDIKAINDKKILEITLNLNKIKAQNSQENIDLKSRKNTPSLSDVNALLLLTIGLILGLTASFVFVRILRRRENRFNAISRSY